MSAGQDARRHGSQRVADPRRTPRQGLDRAVLWSGGIWLASFPLMLLYLAVVGMVGSWLGVDFGSAEDEGRERVLNLVYMGLVLGTLGVSVAVGLAGWRRRRQRLALVAAGLSIVTAVVFLVLPAVV